MGNIQKKYNHENCIICGTENKYSMGLKFFPVMKNRVKAVYRCLSKFQGYDSLVHGGIIVSLLDSAMVHCLFLNNIKAVTAGIDVRFLKPVPCDSFLDIEAELLSSRKNLYKLRSYIFIDGNITVKAEAKFIKI